MENLGLLDVLIIWFFYMLFLRKALVKSDWLMYKNLPVTIIIFLYGLIPLLGGLICSYNFLKNEPITVVAYAGFVVSLLSGVYGLYIVYFSFFSDFERKQKYLLNIETSLSSESMEAPRGQMLGIFKDKSGNIRFTKPSTDYLELSLDAQNIFYRKDKRNFIIRAFVLIISLMLLMLSGPLKFESYFYFAPTILGFVVVGAIFSLLVIRCPTCGRFNFRQPNCSTCGFKLIKKP